MSPARLYVACDDTQRFLSLLNLDKFFICQKFTT